MMADLQRCGNCRFWDPSAPESSEPKDWGTCHRFPPVPGKPQDWLGYPLTVGLFPATHTKRWCGEWEAQETPTP